MMCFLLVHLVAASWAIGQGDQALYISPGGNDQTGDGTRTAPVATFDRAVALLGDRTGSINLLPGEYSGQTLHLAFRPLAGNASILVQPAEGRNSARINYSGHGNFVFGISAANVTLKDLRFTTSASVVILAEMSASHLNIRNCVFDQASSPD